MKEKHIFALWYEPLSEHISKDSIEGSLVTITDTFVMHRIFHVLRLKNGDPCILFDYHRHVQGAIVSMTKKAIVIEIAFSRANQHVGIELTVLLPLLKKEHYDGALYALAALGITTIQLITTEKTQRHWHGPVDYERSQRIMRAAAEQSKYFVLPVLKEPLLLDDAVAQSERTSVVSFVADPDGEPVRDIIGEYPQLEKAFIIVGPEGGLTDRERTLVASHGVRACRLTPTVLTAEQAVALMAGIFRSVFY